MRATVVCFISLLTIASAAALPLAAQQGPRALGAPDTEYEEPFSSVAGLRELRDGRVIVVDPRDKLVNLVDFRSGSATTIGREGSGPQEFGIPLRLFAAPGDTTLLFDPLNSRYVLIGPDGKAINTFRMEPQAPARPAQGAPGAQGRPPAGAPQFQIAGIGMSGRTSDARGRIYGEGSSFSQGPDGRPMSADSVPLVRYDRSTRAMDTLAFIKLPKSNTQVSGSANNREVRIGGANPLAPRDEWSVFPDGRVAIVRADDYRVDFVMPDGSKRAGARIAHTPVRMNAAEIRYEEGLRNAARANQMSIQVIRNNGQMTSTAQMGPPPNAPPLEPLTDWPDVKPPFRSGPTSVLARPNGELWVRRTENAQARGTLYDVITPQGRVGHQVRIQDGWTLVGFGANAIYTTRKDEDDLVYLQRHPTSRGND